MTPAPTSVSQPEVTEPRLEATEKPLTVVPETVEPEAPPATPDETTTAMTARVFKAVSWYTAPEQSIVVTPIHYPKRFFDQATGTPGECSCGKPYLVDENGLVVKRSTKTRGICDSPGKHPLYNGFSQPGSEAQAKTVEEAKKLWSDGPWNIGAVVGKGTGLVVLDVDVRAGGLESMTKLTHVLNEDGAFDVMNTYRYFTSGGESRNSRGYHLYFKADPDHQDLWRGLRKLGAEILPGVEVKGGKSGGMVVASPSLHASGSVYDLDNTQLVIHELTLEDVNALIAAGARASGRVATPTYTVTPGGARPSFGAMAQSVGNAGVMFGGDLSWRSSPAEDDPSVSGYWSREVEYLFRTMTPARTYRSEHHNTLKSLIGGLMILHSPDPSVIDIDDLHRALDENKHYVPGDYMSMVIFIDSEVTVDKENRPAPWWGREDRRPDLIALTNAALKGQIEKINRRMSGR